MLPPKLHMLGHALAFEGVFFEFNVVVIMIQTVAAPSDAQHLMSILRAARNEALSWLQWFATHHSVCYVRLKRACHY